MIFHTPGPLLARVRRVAPALLLACAAPVLAGCNAIFCEDVQIVRTASIDPLRITDPASGATSRAAMFGQVTDNQLSERAFGQLFAAIRRPAASTRNLVVTAQGIDDVSRERVSLTVALPTVALPGTRYPVAGAFHVEHDNAAAPPQEWGFRSASQPDAAEVGFSSARFVSHPANYATTYEATGATGTVEVTGRVEEGFTFAVDLVLADAVGRRRAVKGTVSARAETTGRSCPTLS